MQPLTVSEYIKENQANYLLDDRNADRCSIMEVSQVEEMCRMIRSGRLINDILEEEEGDQYVEKLFNS